MTTPGEDRRTTQQQDAALRMVRNLIKRLRYDRSSERVRPGHLVRALLGSNEGGPLFEGAVRKLYTDTLEALVMRFAVEASGRISKIQVERQLREALRSALIDDAILPEATKIDFEKRLQMVIGQLRDNLLAEGSDWVGWFPIEGLLLGPRQKRVGNVTFAHSQSRPFRAKVGKIFKVDLATIPPGAISAMRTDRRRGKKEIWDKFSHVVIAGTPAKTVDVDAARAQMLVEVRLTLDILTFLGALGKPGPHARAVVRGDAPSGDIPWLLFSGENARWLPRTRVVRFVHLPALANTRPRLLSRIDRLLRAERTPFVERILLSLSLAGRAVGEERIDQQFLLYMFALESMVNQGSSRAAVTDRVRTRVALIVSSRNPERLRAYSRLPSLYQIRSGIVHSGLTDRLNEIQVRNLREIACQAIFRMLTALPFRRMSKQDQLEKWFLRQRFDPTGS